MKCWFGSVPNLIGTHKMTSNCRKACNVNWKRAVQVGAQTSLGKYHTHVTETIVKRERLWPPGLQDDKNSLAFLFRASFKTQHWPEKQGQMLTISLCGGSAAKHNGKVEMTDILHCVTDKNTRSHPLAGMSQNKLLTTADSYVRGRNNNTQNTQASVRLSSVTSLLHWCKKTAVISLKGLWHIENISDVPQSCSACEKEKEGVSLVSKTPRAKPQAWLLKEERETAAKYVQENLSWSSHIWKSFYISLNSINNNAR